MHNLKGFESQIHKCSRCGLCQGACPIYKISGNDCTVSRGQFVMLQGVLKGELKLNQTIKNYLDLCLKCGACVEFCPSGIDVIDIIVAAKYEYFQKSFKAQVVSFLQRVFVFGLFPKFVNFFLSKYKSKSFDKKVLYFGGCASRFKGDKSLIKILNSLNIEVENPNFDCCGISSFVNGDLKGFECSINKYVKILKKYNIKEVVTNCASCEKSLKDYIKWTNDCEVKKFLSTIVVKNVFTYIKENNLTPKLKKQIKVTYHKPCNITNFDDIYWVLANTKNLEYVEMKDYNKCCGLNGLTNIKNRRIISSITREKSQNVIDTQAQYVLTSCLGCETALTIYSNQKYKVMDLLEFLSQNSF